MAYREFVLSRSGLRETMVAVWGLVCQLTQAGEILLIVTEMSKSRAQERKYHAMIKEIAAQVKLNGKSYSAEVWKELLTEQFGIDRGRMGEPLTHPGGMLRSLDGERMVVTRPRTSKFRVKEASDFIEYLYATGCEYGVRWSATAEEIAAAARSGQ